MKHMKTFLIITLTIFLSVLGCTNNEVEMNRRDYIIENNTGISTAIKFYSRVDGMLNNQTSKVLVLFKRKQRLRSTWVYFITINVFSCYGYRF